VVSTTFEIGARGQANSWLGQYARDDENNQDSNGPVPGYTTANLDGRYQVTKQFQIFTRVINLFDTAYQSFGILGADFFPSRCV